MCVQRTGQQSGHERRSWLEAGHGRCVPHASKEQVTGCAGVCAHCFSKSRLFDVPYHQHIRGALSRHTHRHTHAQQALTPTLAGWIWRPDHLHVCGDPRPGHSRIPLPCFTWRTADHNHWCVCVLRACVPQPAYNNTNKKYPRKITHMTTFSMHSPLCVPRWPGWPLLCVHMGRNGTHIHWMAFRVCSGVCVLPWNRHGHLHVPQPHHPPHR